MSETFTDFRAVRTYVRAQWCPTLCDPKDCSLPGSSVDGIFQARIYWSGLPFPTPEDLPDPGIKLSLLHWEVDFLPLCHLGSLLGQYLPSN